MLEATSALALPVFAFYMLVLCNFLPQIVGCRLQNVMNENMWAKHAVGFILLLFLIVFANPEDADRRIVLNVAIAAAVYAWFVATTRCPFSIMMVVLLLLLGSYLAKVSKERQERQNDEAQARSMRAIQNALALAALALSFIGFFLYAAEKKLEYKQRFSWLEFLKGNAKCRNYTQASARIV